MRPFRRYLCSFLVAASLAVAPAIAAPIPSAVVQLSKKYAESQTRAGQAPAKNFQEAYAAHFLSGFTNPFAKTSATPSLEAAAFGQGQAYWREHAERRDQIFRGYGYRRVETDGVASFGFEMSRFDPARRPQESWWLRSMQPLPSLGRNELRGSQVPGVRSVHVHISGYVSPKGRYGHMGIYAREVVVTVCEPTKD